MEIWSHDVIDSFWLDLADGHTLNLNPKGQPFFRVLQTTFNVATCFLFSCSKAVMSPFER